MENFTAYSASITAKHSVYQWFNTRPIYCKKVLCVYIIDTG